MKQYHSKHLGRHENEKEYINQDVKFYLKVRKSIIKLFFPVAQQPPVGQGLLIIQAYDHNSDKPYSGGLLWTSDQPDADTSN